MSLTKVSFSMIQGAPISPFSYGAVGNGSTNDTAALQAAINACPAGGLVYGNGLTYKVTGVSIPRTMTIEGINLVLVDLGVTQASRDAFTVAANGIQFINCGATITAANLTATTNAAGVYSSGYDNVVVDGGTWDGSRNGDYTPGNYRANVYIYDGVDCVVKNTNSLNSFGEQVWMAGCTRPQMLNNTSIDSGGSGILCTESIQSSLVFGNIVIGGLGTNSGMPISGENPVVSFNYIKSSASNGISVGETGGTGGLICNNTIALAGTVAGLGTTASILVQNASGIVVKDNVILPSTLNTSYVAGIAFTNAPVSFECVGNYIDTPGGVGIFVIDGPGNGVTCVIQQNTIKSPWYYGIAVNGFASIVITDNIIDKPNRVNGVTLHSIYIDNASVVPKLIEASGNTITDSTNQANEGVYLNSALSSATLFRLHENAILSWKVEPYTVGRSCVYDVRGNSYAGTVRSGLATLTNGGTTTVVASAQLTSDSVINLEFGNAACFTLNPKLFVSSLTTGSMTITHTAGTAAAEQVRWTIV